MIVFLLLLYTSATLRYVARATEAKSSVPAKVLNEQANCLIGKEISKLAFLNPAMRDNDSDSNETPIISFHFDESLYEMPSSAEVEMNDLFAVAVTEIGLLDESFLMTSTRAVRLLLPESNLRRKKAMVK